jgi:mRNA interferase MazF
VICPDTRQAKGYLFEVTVQAEGEPESVILADHVRCVDWRLRGVRFIRKVPEDVLEEVVAKLETLIINPDEPG